MQVPMTSEQKLIRSASMLARGYPEVWGQFMEALQMRVDEAMGSLVGSDEPFLQVNQGRAQAYSALHRTLKDCVQKQEQIEGTKHG